MRKIISVLLTIIMILSFVSCGKNEPLPEPEFTQMKNIAELAVMECYYHNVAKDYKKVDSVFKFQDKYKHFWIEYEGIVKYGIDAEHLEIIADGDIVTIALPAAKVLSAKINSEKLTPDCYIVDKDSVKITVEDELDAFNQAQSEFLENSAKDEVMLANAQQRAQLLLEEYVKNIGTLFNKTYTIQWVHLNADGSAFEIAPSADTTEKQ